MLPEWVISLPKIFAYESPSLLVCDAVSWVGRCSHVHINPGLAFCVFWRNKIFTVDKKY